ncbi:MAG TPA: CsbD family protein [Marmoricola sp.]|nr:CsbD family protein [Marmoricola sp.]
MGDDDKMQNMADEKVGEAKEAVGDATDDKDLEREGKTDQTKADLKQAGEKVKDAFN